MSDFDYKELTTELEMLLYEAKWRPGDFVRLDGTVNAMPVLAVVVWSGEKKVSYRLQLYPRSKPLDYSEHFVTKAID